MIANKMRYLVTGGAGFIGSNLSLELERLGNSVTVLDNFIKGDRKNLAGFKGKIIEGSEIKLSRLKDKFDVVFHQAAITDTTLKAKEIMFKNNVEGFKNILDFCKQRNCKLIYASSAAVYGRSNSPMREDQKLKPLNIYGQSKLEMENLAKQRFDGSEIIGLRYFNVFGPREHFKGKMASMIFQLAQQIRMGNNPRIFKYGEQARDHIYVRDVVNANLEAISYQGSGIFNVGTGIKTSFNQLVQYLNEILGTKYKAIYINNPHLDSYQDCTIADTSKATKELGFTSRYNVYEAIKDYIKFLDA